MLESWNGKWTFRKRLRNNSMTNVMKDTLRIKERLKIASWESAKGDEKIMKKSLGKCFRSCRCQNSFIVCVHIGVVWRWSVACTVTFRCETWAQSTKCEVLEAIAAVVGCPQKAGASQPFSWGGDQSAWEWTLDSRSNGLPLRVTSDPQQLWVWAKSQESGFLFCHLWVGRIAVNNL